MVRRIDAIFTQGTLRPLEPLALPEGTRVHLSVETDASTDALALPTPVAKVRTPRLANSKDAADFVMEVREDRDAGV
jgi:predicted DNA-binding antitoxin AbrB/MazE fold protein